MRCKACDVRLPVRRGEGEEYCLKCWNWSEDTLTSEKTYTGMDVYTEVDALSGDFKLITKTITEEEKINDRNSETLDFLD